MFIRRKWTRAFTWRYLENIENLTTLISDSFFVGALAWDPHFSVRVAVSEVGEQQNYKIRFFQNLNESLVIKIEDTNSDNREYSSFSRYFPLVFDPFHQHVAICSVGKQIFTFDVRSGGKTSAKSSDIYGHFLPITSIEANVNVEHQLVTSGQNCRVLYWDLRKLQAGPVSELCPLESGAHCHWITSVKLNPFHDQLVLTSGTDRKVALWRSTMQSSISLTKLAKMNLENNYAQNETTSPDSLLCCYSDLHEESVYSSCWSAECPWHWASVSFDGKVIFGEVPRSERTRILLQWVKPFMF
jgi:WD40 repeat protein